MKAHDNETVLLTGGLGFIGSNLVDELLVAGYRVVVFDDKSTGTHYNSKATTIIGDITEEEHFKRLNLRIDYIVHFAAAISVAESMKDPEKYKRINIRGSENVFKWAGANGVKKVVTASSAAVYGTPKNLPVVEKQELSPISPYATSKLQMEEVAKKYHLLYGMDIINLRFFNVYGPRQNPKSAYSGVISKFMDQAFSNSDIVMFGDGNATRDFVFVKDIALANIAAIQRGKGYQIFNVGTGISTSLLQLATEIQSISKSTSKIQFKPEREGDIKHSLANVSAIKRGLKWSAKYSLKEGLTSTLNWFKESQKRI